MSIARGIRRRAAQKNGIKWPGKKQPVIMMEDGGYRVLNPRRGWQRFSARRLWAIAQVAEKMGKRDGARV